LSPELKPHVPEHEWLLDNSIHWPYTGPKFAGGKK